MSGLALSVDDFAKRYLDPATERLWSMTRRELRRRRMSRRTFLQMSEDDKWALMQEAVRRYGDGTAFDWLWGPDKAELRRSLLRLVK